MAAQTLTGLTATQKTDGTYKVDFGFNAVDGDNDLLSLVYEYKLSTASTWSTATTTAPSTVTASGAGVAVAGTWDLDADFDGNLQGVDFNFRVTSTKAATTAAGSLTAIAAAIGTGIEEGDTFTVGTETYEFVITAEPTEGNIAVELASAADSATLVKAAIIASINASSEIMAATSGAGELITLTAILSGVAGNNAITQSISNSATLTPVSLTGGAAPEVVAASVTVSDADTGSADTVPGTVAEITTNKHDVEINVFEGTYAQKGFVAAGGFRWSRAKAAVEAIRSGKESIFTIYSDRAIGEGVAVLVSVGVYADLVGSATNIHVVEKNVHWLMNTAWRSFSQLFKPATTVYAIQTTEISAKGDIVGLKVIKGATVAYLISYADYIKLRD